MSENGETVTSEIATVMLLGAEDDAKPVRYFIARNSVVAKYVDVPKTGWQQNGFINLKYLLAYEGKWETLLSREGHRQDRVT